MYILRTCSKYCFRGGGLRTKFGGADIAVVVLFDMRGVLAFLILRHSPLF